MSDCPPPYDRVMYTERVYNFDGTRWVADEFWFIRQRRTDIRVLEISPPQFTELSPIIDPANPGLNE